MLCAIILPSMRNKWALLLLLCATFAVYTVDRALLGPLAIPIQADTGITDVQFGILNAAVFWTYALLVPFAGLMGDRINRLLLVGVAAVLWSVMTVFAGFAVGFWTFLVLASISVTVPQTFYSPAAFALIAESHRETRSVAMSCHQAAFYLGWLASGGVVAAILSLFGSWRWAYYLFGGVGLVLGAIALLAGRVNMRGVKNDPRMDVQDIVSFRESLRAFFCCPSAVLAALGHVAFTFACFGYTSWGPKFVAEKFALSPGAAGTGVMFWHFAAALVAILLTGAVTDRLIVRWPRFRLALQAATLVAAAPVLVLFGFSKSLMLVWFAAAAFGVAKGMFEANSVNSLYDVIPSRYRASAIGYLNVMSGLLGSLAPMILGYFSQQRGVDGLNVGFSSLGAILVVAFGLLLVSFFFTFRRDRIGG